MIGLTTLKKLRAMRPQKSALPADYLDNAWILSIEDDDPITDSGVVDTLNFLRDSDRNNFVANFHNFQAQNGTLLNDCRNTFDHFDRANPSSIWTPKINHIIN